MTDRKFTDAEVARILTRAAELQSTTGDDGTQLEEIERAAAEAGIDPALVRTAAAELGTGPTAAPSSAERFFGPTRIQRDVVLEGEITTAAHSLLNEAFQTAFGRPVMTATIGNVIQWSFQDQASGRGVFASITPGRGRTVVRVQERLGGLMGGIYGGVGGGAGGGGVIPMLAVGGAALFGPVGGVLGGLVGAVLSLFATRALYKAIARSRERQLQEVFDALVAAVQQVSSSSAGSVTSASTANALDEARARQGLQLGADERAPLDRDVTAAIEAVSEAELRRRR